MKLTYVLLLLVALPMNLLAAECNVGNYDWRALEIVEQVEVLEREALHNADEVYTTLLQELPCKGTDPTNRAERTKQLQDCMLAMCAEGRVDVEDVFIKALRTAIGSLDDNYAEVIQVAKLETEEEPEAMTRVLSGAVLTVGPNQHLIIYMHLPHFTPCAVNAAIELMNKYPAALAVIVDLRGNIGGHTDAAFTLANALLTEGSLGCIVTSQGVRNCPEASDDGVNSEWLLAVVLMDEHTASASEVFIRALDGNERLLEDGGSIGQPTHGKGIYQIINKTGQVVHLKYTAGHLEDPNGKKYHKVPFVPEIVVEDDPSTPFDEVVYAGLRAITEYLED